MSVPDASPLTVVFSLLSRADSTPPDLRPPGAGRSQHDVFESDPNLNFEHWGEYWRKVHGARFLHRDEADDTAMDKLLRYDQLHRFAPGPTQTDAPPYRAPTDAYGRLWPDVAGRIERYRRPQWDGAAYLGFASEADIAEVLGSARVQQKIMPEDHLMFRDIAPILSRQHILLPGAGSEPVSLVKLHVRKPELSRSEFQHWWLGEHAGLVAEHAGPLLKRYVQLHNVGPTSAGLPFYHADASRIDGVTLMSFGSVTALERFLSGAGQAAIANDERRMADTSAGEWWTAISMTLVDQR
ncbi:hypothetical protein GTP58_22570 [Duganella sp. CY15W]|uniref:EthD domain-containing protein n=1 Tax=Duganella sp. CY15W TaxID=2692172 RepID=UPI0013683AF5|nr:EthD domain-containing protein [Duganella sp. CY15W]MYM31126.1 hypothetical protein [Duganella sp. CY15W]